MNRTASAVVTAAVLVAWAAPARASSAPGAAGTALSQQERVSLVGKKLGRGLVNVSTGWIELPKHIYVLNEEWGPVFGAVFGGLHGLEVSTVRTLAGIYETATFPVPVPAEYAPVVLPSSVFTWEGLYLRGPQ